MFKLLISGLLIVLLTSCGVDTASSSTENDLVTNEPVVIEDLDLIDQNLINDDSDNLDNVGNIDVINQNPIGGVIGWIDPDLINPNPIDPNPIDPNPIDPNPIDPDDNSTVPGSDPIVVVPNDGSISDYDTENAIEDPFACILGDPNDGYTNRSIIDNSFDSEGFTDEEHGVGISSRLSYNNDMSKSEVTLLYYDLMPTRAYDVVSTYADDYRIDIDIAWATNDKKFVYVQIPKNENNLYECYRYDLNSIDIDRTLTSVKVYRKK